VFLLLLVLDGVVKLNALVQVDKPIERVVIVVTRENFIFFSFFFG